RIRMQTNRNAIRSPSTSICVGIWSGSPTLSSTRRSVNRGGASHLPRWPSAKRSRTTGGRACCAGHALRASSPGCTRRPRAGGQSTRQEACEAREDLFRFRLPYRWIYFLCARGKAFKVPGPVGKYLLLRRRRKQVLCYDEPSRTLTFPAPCRPPLLIERALVL